jgi:hypothetical protein
MINDEAPPTHRLKIKPSTLDGLGQPYFPDETPYMEYGGDTGMETVSVMEGGHDYGLGETLTVGPELDLLGQVTVAEIGEGGAVVAVTISNPGNGYEEENWYETESNGAGVGCEIVVLTVAPCSFQVPIGFGDWRLPMTITDWDWHALKIVHNNNKELFRFHDIAPWSGTGCTFSADANHVSVAVSGASREALGDFQPGDQFSGVNKGTKLSAACADAATTIHVTSTDGFPTAGDLCIDEINTISYTGKTGGGDPTFTGCTGVVAHDLDFDRKVELIGPWLSHYRFVKVQWLPTVTEGGAADTSGSMRFHLGNKWWNLTYKAADLVSGYLEAEIDLCRPHGITGGTVGYDATQQSWLDYYFPRSVGQIGGSYVAGQESTSGLEESCEGLVPLALRGRGVENEWYWGVSRVNQVKLTELTDGRTYKVGTITGIIKDGSKLVTCNQWGWRADRELDPVAKVRSGLRALTGSGPPEARFAESDEILGWVIVDGMVAAEITGELWDQQGHDSELACCDVTSLRPALGYLDDDGDWFVNLDVWPKRPERVPVESIVIEPYEASVPVAVMDGDSSVNPRY